MEGRVVLTADAAVVCGVESRQMVGRPAVTVMARRGASRIEKVMNCMLMRQRLHLMLALLVF